MPCVFGERGCNGAAFEVAVDSGRESAARDKAEKPAAAVLGAALKLAGDQSVDRIFRVKVAADLARQRVGRLLGKRRAARSHLDKGGKRA